jgi:PKD repeat protein
MKKTWFQTRKQFALSGFSRLCLALVFCILAGSSLASAQTTQPQALAYWTCYCSGACNDDPCSFPNALQLWTELGRTSGPNDTQPTWSADGQQIAFTRNGDIYVMNANLLTVNLTNTGNNSDPAWSPDGARIAFVSTRDGQSELYLMNPDGSNVVRLTNNMAMSAWNPAWSRDGAHIAFTCGVDDGNADICSINADGTGFVRLTTDSASDSGPTWSPDGLSIAFSTTRYGTDPVIAVMNPDGTGVTQVGTGVVGWSPVWSPDGAQIAFEGNGIVECFLGDCWGWGIEAIYTMKADGTNAALLANDSKDPAWRPAQVPISTFKFTCDQTTCNFDASGSRDSYAPITNYAWDFGDQTTGTGVTVSHAYANRAAYVAKLTVTDSNGAIGTRFWTINLGPVAVITVSCTGLTCNFAASYSKASSGTITSYSWNFGDGATGAGITVSHTFAARNYYNVTLTVADGTGATGTQSRTIAVGSPPHASFSFGCDRQLTCSFDGSDSVDSGGTITNYSWNFGDGTTASGPSSMVSHKYATGNSYNVTLTVADDGGATGTQSRTIDIISPPYARFFFACNLLTCSFDGSNSFDSDGRIVSYAWSFGDNTAGSGPTISHTYSAGGYRTVTLTVTDNAGATDFQSQTLFANSPPVASFTFSCDRLTCTFDGSASHDSDDGIVKWSWNFGDGSSGSNPTTTHTYFTPGNYVVTLTVTDAHGATGIQSSTVQASHRKQ